MTEFSKRIYEITKQIPAGRVVSYGQLAALSGNPRKSRAVGYAMRACSDPAVPCHRVVYSDGRLTPAFGAGGVADQAALLRAEGVPFLADGRVDMQSARYCPKERMPM